MCAQTSLLKIILKQNRKDNQNIKLEGRTMHFSLTTATTTYKSRQQDKHITLWVDVSGITLATTTASTVGYHWYHIHGPLLMP